MVKYEDQGRRLGKRRSALSWHGSQFLFLPLIYRPDLFAFRSRFGCFSSATIGVIRGQEGPTRGTR
jgi:hypothetical protein